MVVLDSNIVIYLANPEGYPEVRQYVSQHEYCVSVLTVVEVLGYRDITPDDDRDLRAILAGGDTIWLSEEIVATAVGLRRERAMSLPDAVIAATALTGGFALATHNVADFRGIPGLVVIDPVGAGANR